MTANESATTDRGAAQAAPTTTGPAELPVRDDLRGQQPYGAPQLDVAIALNTNENPHAPSPMLVAEIGARVAAAATTLNRYPDREATELRTDLANYLGHGLDMANVWAANGSNEVLQQLMQAFGGPGRRALGFEPTYSMHSLICRGTGTDYVAVDREPETFAVTAELAVAAVREHRPDVTFLCSPNNPTGTAIDAEVVAAVHDATDGMVVVDEAYAEFSHGESLLGLLPGRRRLVISRTMSKAFALAGARLGYLAADPAVVDALRLVRLPYHLSAVTQATCRAALAHADELLGTVEAVKAQRDRIVTELRAAGLAVVESDANFVLFSTGSVKDQSVVWQDLLDRGVLVRDVGLNGWLRVSAGTEFEVTGFLAAMDEVMKERQL